MGKLDPTGKFNFARNRGVIVVSALLLLLATANDVVGAVTGLVAWARTSTGQAVLLVSVTLIMLILLLDRFLGSE